MTAPTTALSTRADYTRHVERGPRRITDAFPLGINAAGALVGWHLDEHGAFLWGPAGSGRTVTLQTIAASASQNTDTVTWAVDHECAGYTFAPLNESWALGQAPAPAIDWIASNAEESLKLVEAAHRIAFARARDRSGAPRPHLLVLIEAMDLSTALGQETDRLTTEISRVSRRTGVTVVRSAHRALADGYVSIEFKNNTNNLLGLRGQPYAELFFGFGPGADFDQASLQHRGTGWMTAVGQEGLGAVEPQPVRVLHTSAEDLRQIGAEFGPGVPQLDAASLAAAGADYPERWQRTGPETFPDFRR